jgi:hypothetical protein
MLDGVDFSCQQIGVNIFYKCIEFQVNSFDSYWEIKKISLAIGNLKPHKAYRWRNLKCSNGQKYINYIVEKQIY